MRLTRRSVWTRPKPSTSPSLTALTVRAAAALALLATTACGAVAEPADGVEPWADLFRQHATDESPASVLAAQARVESGFDPDAVSPAGAEGMMQFVPATWARFGFDGDGDGRARVQEPADAVPSAVAYRSYLRDVLADLPGADDPAVLDRLVLAGYNAGPGAVLRAGGVPDFPETEAYVERVARAQERYAYLDG